MTATKRIKISADTSELSASLSRVDNSGKNIARSLGKSVPVLGQMTSATGLMAVAATGVVSVMRQWLQALENGNREQNKAVMGARQLAAATGDFGAARHFREHAAAVSTQGVVTSEGLIAGSSAFRGAAPDLSPRSTMSAMAQMQRAGTAGFDVDKTARIAGMLLHLGQIQGATEDQRIANAFDYAAYIMASMGDSADQAVQILPRLLMQGLSLDDALGVFSSLRSLGSRQRSAAVGALSQFKGRRIRGVEGAMRIIGQHSDFRRGELPEARPAENVRGFIQRGLSELVSDPETRASIVEAVTANRITEIERTRSTTDDRLISAAQRERLAQQPGFRPVSDFMERHVTGASEDTRALVRELAIQVQSMGQAQMQYVDPE
jgi:hypothetical protein